MVVIRTLRRRWGESMSHTTNLPNLLHLSSASSKDTLILKTQSGLWAAANGNVVGWPGIPTDPTVPLVLLHPHFILAQGGHCSSCCLPAGDVGGNGGIRRELRWSSPAWGDNWSSPTLTTNGDVNGDIRAESPPKAKGGYGETNSSCFSWFLSFCAPSALSLL